MARFGAGRLFATAAFSVISSAAFAAAADGDALVLEEITVTARQRVENLMSIPVAVTAFTAKTIEDANISRANDFLALIPNVTFINAQDSGTSFLTIRGLSQVRNSESPVAVMIDGVLTASPLQLTQELFDIEQIEVLKGPQGALYGRNAIGGAITIRTKQPTNEFEGFVRLGTGNDGLVNAQASVSGPIVEDKLFFRISGSHRDHEGHIRNVYLNETVDQYRDQSARALIKWTPNEKVSVDLRASMSDTEGGALYYVVNSDLYVGGPDFFGDPNDTSVPITSNIRGLDSREIRDLSAKIDVETQLGTVSSITAYNYVNERSASDAAPYSSSPNDGTQDGRVKTKAWSQELRLTSSSDQRLRYIVGAYYLNTDRTDLLTLGLDNGPGILVEGIHYNDPINPTFYAVLADRNNDAYAGFAQLNYDITEQLELSGAIRYDRDERKQDDLLDVPDAGVRSADFSKWQPKATLTWKPTGDLTVFANYSQGFRSGGFNPPGVAILAANSVPPVVGVQDVYKKEVSETFELGLKSRLLDNRLSFNASLFKTKLDDSHYFAYLSFCGCQIITNVDRVDLWGFEADAVFRAMEGLDLFAGFGMTDSKIDEYSIDPTAEGNWAPYVPKYTFHSGFQYRVAVTDKVSMLARMDYERRGKQYWEPNNIASRKAIDLVRATFGFEDEENGWSLMGWAKNLFDEKYNEEFVAGGFAYIAQPRTYGVDLTKKF